MSTNFSGDKIPCNFRNITFEWRIRDIISFTDCIESVSASCCPDLSSLVDPAAPASIVVPASACTSAGCTTTVTCDCPAGLAFCAISFSQGSSTNAASLTGITGSVTSPTITCTPSCTYSIQKPPPTPSTGFNTGNGGPFDSIFCYGS